MWYVWLVWFVWSKTPLRLFLSFHRFRILLMIQGFVSYLSFPSFLWCQSFLWYCSYPSYKELSKCFFIQSLFFPQFPAYMKNMFSLRSSFYDLRGNNILSLCKPRTTSFGLSCFSYFSAKQWNALPDCIRTSDFTEFKRNIQGMTFV